MTRTDSASRRPRLWVVSELYYPEQTSTGYFLTCIAEGLSGDFDVRVLCSQPSYSERGTRAPRFERRNGTTIHRLRSTRFDKNRVSLRILNVITFTFAVFIAGLLRFRRGDRILVVTNPPLVPLAAALPARAHACRSYLLVHDVYPEILAATGILPAAGLPYRLLGKVFAGTFRLYGKIVVLGRDMAELVQAKIAPAEREIALIPNWADIDQVKPLTKEKNSFVREHGLAGKFVVQFSGNIGRTHDVELLLDAAALLRDRRDIAFTFIGQGGKSALVEQATSERPGNLIFLSRQPRERLGEMLAAADLTVVSFVPGMLGLSVPSRMYNIMAAGVALLAVADPASELALTVTESGGGWVMSEGDAADIARLIVRLADDPARRLTGQRGAAGRTAVMQRYTLSVVLKLYRDLFR